MIRNNSSPYDKSYYRRLIEQYFDLLISKQLDGLCDLFAENVVMFFPAAGIDVKGRASVRTVLEKFFGDYPNHRVTLKHVAIDGTFGATEQHVILVDQQGRKSEFPDNANHFRFAEGRIAQIRIYSDFASGASIHRESKSSAD